MHIEPGVVDGAKIVLSYATAAVSLGIGAKMAVQSIRQDGGIAAFALRATIATGLVFSFFEILPHAPVGVSEVHLILGTTLLLLFGGGPAAFGLAAGLALQGVFFAPFDLPQYGMNVTTLIVPLFAMQMLAVRIIKPGTAYQDVGYGQALKLSLAYQGGIVAWVGFWAFYGHGFTASAFSGVSSFAAAYMIVVLIEPLADLAVLAVAKTLGASRTGKLVQPRLHAAA